jgi:replicative DNA helicase
LSLPTIFTTESREEELYGISRSLKLLAKELSVPVIALARLSRTGEERATCRPKIADFGESCGMEWHTDTIIFIHRDEVDKKSEENSEKGATEIIIAKQRNGRAGTVKMGFLEKYGSFENLVCSGK